MVFPSCVWYTLLFMEQTPEPMQFEARSAALQKQKEALLAIRYTARAENRATGDAQELARIDFQLFLLQSGRFFEQTSYAYFGAKRMDVYHPEAGDIQLPRYMLDTVSHRLVAKPFDEKQGYFTLWRKKMPAFQGRRGTLLEFPLTQKEG